MTPTITQQNLYLIIPSKISWMVKMLTEEKGISIIDALKAIYTSNVYKKLEDESTKMWNLGPVALYQDFTEEFQQ